MKLTNILGYAGLLTLVSTTTTLTTKNGLEAIVPELKNTQIELKLPIQKEIQIGNNGETKVAYCHRFNNGFEYCRTKDEYINRTRINTTPIRTVITYR